MDYEKFKKEYESFDLYMQDYRSAFDLDEHPVNDVDYLSKFPSGSNDDVLNFPSDDRVNSPSHYTGGRVEAIDVIEDAIKDAKHNAKTNNITYEKRKMEKEKPQGDGK